MVRNRISTADQCAGFNGYQQDGCSLYNYNFHHLLIQREFSLRTGIEDEVVANWSEHTYNFWQQLTKLCYLKLFTWQNNKIQMNCLQFDVSRNQYFNIQPFSFGLDLQGKSPPVKYLSPSFCPPLPDFEQNQEKMGIILLKVVKTDDFLRVLLPPYPLNNILPLPICPPWWEQASYATGNNMISKIFQTFLCWLYLFHTLVPWYA